MPQDAVVIDATIETMPRERESFESVCVLGLDESGSANTGEVVRVRRISEIETRFGTDTQLTEELTGALEQGVEFLYGYKIPFSEEGKTASLSAGLTELGEVVSFLKRENTLDVGGSGMPLATYATVAGTETNTIINTYTGEVNHDVDTDDLTYDVVDWEAVKSDLGQYNDIGLITLANLHTGEEFADADLINTTPDTGEYKTDEAYQYGDKAKMVELANNLDAVFVMSVSGETIDEAKAHTYEVTELVGDNIFAVAHPFDSTQYLMNGNFVGAVSIVDQTDKLMWKEVRNVDDSQLLTDLFNTSEIDQIETDGQLNALIKKKDNYVFSNGYSTTDEEGFTWLDIYRTKTLVKQLITSRLETLLMKSKVPMTEKGLGIIESTIDSACRRATEFDAIVDSFINEDGERELGHKIYMPSINSDSIYRDARRVEDIVVQIKVPGHIQMIEIDLTVLI